MRSGQLWLGIGRNRPQRFSPPVLVRVLAAETKSVAPARSARARERSPPDSARTYVHYQVAEARQMCWLPYIAGTTTPALEFAGRDCWPPSKFTRRHRPTTLA